MHAAQLGGRKARAGRIVRTGVGGRPAVRLALQVLGRLPGSSSQELAG
jgi:hypothetical protein